MKKITLSEKIISVTNGYMTFKEGDVKKSVKKMMRNINDRMDEDNNVKIWIVFDEIIKEFGKELV